ncbi:MAG: phenylacetate--CoA ligase family protein [Dehalococcoidia bacterium]|nr:phenylacetate--CoA ligase family protein [Dehalococcoidia bacterium]
MKQPSITAKAIGLLPALPEFLKTYNLLKKSQWWSREQLEEYQVRQLGRILNHAYENVPYYRKIFDERGLKPDNIQDFSDLQKLPFLTKEIVKDNLNELKAGNYHADKFEYVTTGGSTGIPLGFYYEKGVSRAIEWAFIKSLWERVGYNFRDKCAIIKGYVVSSASTGKLWDYSFFGRWLMLSSYHMTEDNLPHYIRKIREFKPGFIQAFPSAVTILARYMKSKGVEPFPSVKAILCGSENFYPSQRELLEDTFHCRVYSWYGHAERVVLAGECEQSADYHAFPEYGITELVREDGSPISNDNEPGAIVGTGLTNYAMPLIRYKTDDLAVRSSIVCPCHRGYPMLKNVQGRWLQEFIITGTNRPISITAVNMHSNVFDNVEQFQFYQEKKGEVVFNIVRKDSYTERDTEYIRSELLKKLGDDVRLEISFVNHIPRTGRGKYRFLVQKLPVEFGSSAVSSEDGE